MMNFSFFGGGTGKKDGLMPSGTKQTTDISVVKIMIGLKNQINFWRPRLLF